MQSNGIIGNHEQCFWNAWGQALSWLVQNYDWLKAILILYAEHLF